MGWAVGYDDNWQRDIGYGVPAICDHPDCEVEIDRGLGYVCGADAFGGEKGCGLFFCSQHQVDLHQRCERCAKRRKPFTPKPDTYEWVHHKHTDESWEEWRNEQEKKVTK